MTFDEWTKTQPLWEKFYDADEKEIAQEVWAAAQGHVEKDAARYRWLRGENARLADDGEYAGLAVVFDDDDGGNWIGSDLDAVVDAEMARDA